MLDIEKITSDKIRSMEESGKLQAYIEEKATELITKAVDNAMNGWELKNEIEKQISASVSNALKAIDFTAYNSFIANKIKQIVEGVLQEDAAEKVQQTFEGAFVKKYESIKLSEIISAYRSELIDDMDDVEKYEHNNEFFASIYGNDGIVRLRLAAEDDCKDDGFYFAIFTGYPDRKTGKLGNVRISGSSIESNLILSKYRKFETLLINLYYNETPIIIDIESDSDIDCTLGLDY